LNDFIFFFFSGKPSELQCGLPRFNGIPSDLSHPISGECQMGVPVKGTPTLKSVKWVFDTRKKVYGNNDVPCSWKVRYLYYFNGFTLLGQINGVNHS